MICPSPQYPERRRASVILYYFSLLQRDCENLTLYNVVFPFSEWIRTPRMKANQKRCAAETSDTISAFSSCFQTNFGANVKGRHDLSFSTQPQRRPSCPQLEWCSSLQWRGPCMEALVCGSWVRVCIWTWFCFVFLKWLIVVWHSSVGVPVAADW